MKKLLITGCVVLCVLTAFGQKDLELKIISPNGSTKVYANQWTYFTYSLKNIGKDTISVNDSLFIYIKNDGYKPPFTVNTITQQILPNDSVIYTDRTKSSVVPDTSVFCVGFTASNNGVNFDSDTTNNEDCVLFIDGNLNTGIAKTSVENTKLLLYPNPAVSTISITTQYANAAQAIITDINGKQLLKADLANGFAQLSVEGLRGGVYFCKLLTAGTKLIATTKFVVNR